MKSKFVKFGGIFIVLMALAALIGSTMTFAQDETPGTPNVPEVEAPIEDAPGVGHFERGRGGNRLFTQEEHDQALADALGITVEALTTARETARQTLIDQAVVDGKITQEQADAIISGAGLRSVMGEIFNPDVMKTAVANALGLTVEELDAAQADGQRLPEIAAAQGVELSTIQEAVQTAREEAIAQAVVDGLITQEQADQLQEHGSGFGGHGGPRGGKGGPRGNGNGNGRFGGGFQNQPETLQGDNG